MITNERTSLAFNWSGGIVVASIWIANQIVSWTFPTMNENSWLVETFNHSFTYKLYGAASIIGLIFVWRFIPETKGKTLEELWR